MDCFAKALAMTALATNGTKLIPVAFLPMAGFHIDN